MAVGNATTKKADYDVKVLKAARYDWGIAVDIEVNGIKIYGCVHRQGKKADGTEWSMLSLPSKKANDGNYYNHVFFPINKELLTNIEKQIEKLLE